MIRECGSGEFSGRGFPAIPRAPPGQISCGAEARNVFALSPIHELTSAVKWRRASCLAMDGVALSALATTACSSEGTTDSRLDS